MGTSTDVEREEKVVTEAAVRDRVKMETHSSAK